MDIDFDWFSVESWGNKNDIKIRTSQLIEAILDQVHWFRDSPAAAAKNIKG